MNLKSIKVMILISFVGFVTLIWTMSERYTTISEATVSGPPASRTGAPGELTCTDCHNAGTGAGTFSIVAPTNYVPGQTYSIQVKHVTTNNTRKRWGFQMTALANNVSAGTLAIANGTTQIKTSSSNRSYIEHTSTGTFANQTGGATWTFNWTAPATSVGNVTFYAAGVQADNNGSENNDWIFTTNSVSQPSTIVVIAPKHVVSDFNGDFKTDPAVIRNQSGAAVWYINTPTGMTTLQFGFNTDKFVPADYDGDGKTDIAIFRDGVWWTMKSATNTVSAEQFGTVGDIPVTGDYDGDGLADLCVFRQGDWYWKRSTTGVMNGVHWGNSTDKPLSGDFDGDGKADPAVYRNGSEWWIYQTATGTVLYKTFAVAGDIPVPADYDGNGSTDIAVFRPSTGTWYTSTDVNNNYYGAIYWGMNGDVPAPGDYDGDGKADAAVYRNGLWYIRQSSDSSSNVQSFGTTNDTVVPYLRVQ